MAIQKIMGSETEYGIMVRNDSDFDPISKSLLLINSYQVEPFTKFLWDYDQEDPLVDARGFELDEEFEIPDQQDNMSINKILTNGARYYLDHAHPEFSTPECSNPRDLVRFEKAGEKILDISRIRAEQKLPPEQRILIYKNNSDRKGNSYGSHENYLMDRNTPFNLIIEHLIPFLVTRVIFCGSGKVGAENETEFVPFQISQRADFFETEIGLDTMVKRPIINTRDEPHANREKYRRLHVIVGDSNMSEYTIYLKTGITSIVLSMIEDQFLEKSLVLRNPVKALKDLSRDLTCTKLVELDNGQKLTAVEMQRIYLERAQQYYAEKELDPIIADILDKWTYVLDALAVNPFSLYREIDWVIKWHLINSYIEKRGERWDSSRVAMMDLQYHDIRADKGLYYLLQKTGEVERIVTNEEIFSAIENPPIDTRAYFRGMCLKKFRNHIFGVNWDSLSFNVDEGPIKRVLMEEPAKGSKAHVEELLARSHTVEELLVNLAL